MAKNGSAALEEYDAYAARVEAQRVKAHASVRRRGEGATPLNRPGDGRASVSERETMSERLVPNELSAVSENKRRTPAATPTEDADASFEFAPATADARAPATPRALSFLDTPVARTKLDLTDGSTTTTPTTTTTTNAETTNAADDAAKPFARARSLDRWAAKARAKLHADAASELNPASDPAPTAPGPSDPSPFVETVEEETSCCGCVRKRRVVRERASQPPPPARALSQR